MRVDEISRVLIVGAGAMGRQIGFQCAASGFEVTLHDTGQDVLNQAMRRLGELAEHSIRNARLGEKEAKETLDRVQTETDPERAGADADLVSESVPEDPQLKGKILGRFNEICPERTIFTANTSSLLPSMFADLTGRPDRFAALHFHDTRVTDTVYSITEYWARQTGSSQQYKNAEFLKGYVDQGLLGQKTGSGFYTYHQDSQEQHARAS